MKEKLSQLTELIKLARSNKNLREREYKFIRMIADRLGIGRVEFEKLFDRYIEYTPPISEFERILQFHRFVLLMNIDEEVHHKDLAVVHHLGIRMGLNPLVTEKVLTEMYKYPSKLMPAKNLIDIYKAQYN